MHSRPALLPVNHPLSYSCSDPTLLAKGTPNDIKNHTSNSTFSLAEPRTLEEQVRYLYEHQQITNLLNEYAYVLDVCMVNHSAAQKWADLFADDCDVTFPFGNHKGKGGLAQWAMNAETRFHRMLVSI